MKSIASSAPAVLISHIAAKTDTIRLGAGGVMLPNHAPLVIAEQYGTLAELYPDRIDLGLGRAPGTDQRTVLALRRDPRSGGVLPGRCQGTPGVPVRALPRRRRDRRARHRHECAAVHPGILPLRRAARRHAGGAVLLRLALRTGRSDPGGHRLPGELPALPEHPEPYVFAAVNVTAADSEAEATAQHEQNLRQRVKTMALRGRSVTEEELDMVMSSPAAEQILSMMRYTAVEDMTISSSSSVTLRPRSAAPAQVAAANALYSFSYVLLTRTPHGDRHAVSSH